MPTPTNRHVYVIGIDPGPFKIGVATNPKDRLASIQTGSHKKMVIAYSVCVPFWEAATIEQRAHALLHDVRLSGEWFDVSVTRAKQAIAMAIQELKTQVKRPIQEASNSATDVVSDHPPSDEPSGESVSDINPDALTPIERTLLDAGLISILYSPEYLESLCDRIARTIDRIKATYAQENAPRGMPQIPYRPRAPIHNGSTEPPPDSVDNL